MLETHIVMSSLISRLVLILMFCLILLRELIFRGMLLRVIQRLHFQTKFCILLTLMISLVHLCVSKFLVPKYLLTNPLRFKIRTSLSLLSHVGWRFWVGEHELLTISIFCLE
jgi:hypothetical protein